MFRQKPEGKIVKLKFALPDEVEAALDRYRPRASRSPTMATLFPQVRDRVLAAVRATGPQVPETARSRMSFVTWYATWLVSERLWDPDAGPVPFAEATVDRFVQSARDDGYGSPDTLRSHLMAVGRANVPFVTVPDVEPVSDVACGPYSPDEAQELWRAASAFRHDKADPTVAAVVAAGLGAGLTGEDFRQVRGRHVTRDSDGHVYVQVTGTDRDRTVPVVREWADRLMPLADLQGDLLLVGGSEVTSTHPVGPVSIRARRAGMSTMSIRRLRATWLLGRMDDGVPVDVLVRYAGLQSAQAMHRLLPYVTSREPEKEFAWVRGDLVRR